MDFAADGYVFLRAVADVSLVEALRDDVLTLLRETGWGPSEWPAHRHEFQPLARSRESFAALAASLTPIARSLVGNCAVANEQSLVRVIWPDDPSMTTPPHQDVQYVPDAAATLWVPLVDCPRKSGALRVIPGSHREPRAPHFHEGSMVPFGVEVSGNDEWVTDDFAIGDAVAFAPLLVHGALPNLGTEARLSVDFRWSTRQ